MSHPAASLEDLAYTLCTNRPSGQVAAVARQLTELLQMANVEEIPFEPDQPVAIGLSGGRLRLAFMHPDMPRFFGPAWQMPIGAADSSGDEQIVLLVQPTDDQLLHLLPSNDKYREAVNALSIATETILPRGGAVDLYQYEAFGRALIDLAEAMLKRAFGEVAVAVRINGAGQGGYFQVHVDKRLADPDEIKHFLRVAFYARFGLSPQPAFVEVHPGGGALGLRLERYRDLPQFIDACESQ